MEVESKEPLHVMSTRGLNQLQDTIASAARMVDEVSEGSTPPHPTEAEQSPPSLGVFLKTTPERLEQMNANLKSHLDRLRELLF